MNLTNFCSIFDMIQSCSIASTLKIQNKKQKHPPLPKKKRKQNPRMRTPKKFEKYLANSNLLKINVYVLILQPNYDGTCVQLRKVQSYIHAHLFTNLGGHI